MVSTCKIENRIGSFIARAKDIKMETKMNVLFFYVEQRDLPLAFGPVC